MQTSLDVQDLWRMQYRDCGAEPPLDLDTDRALFIRSVHAGHGPECRQYLAAVAYCRAHVISDRPSGSYRAVPAAAPPEPEVGVG